MLLRLMNRLYFYKQRRMKMKQVFEQMGLEDKHKALGYFFPGCHFEIHAESDWDWSEGDDAGVVTVNIEAIRVISNDGETDKIFNKKDGGDWTFKAMCELMQSMYGEEMSEWFYENDPETAQDARDAELESYCA